MSRAPPNYRSRAWTRLESESTTSINIDHEFTFSGNGWLKFKKKILSAKFFGATKPKPELPCIDDWDGILEIFISNSESGLSDEVIEKMEDAASREMSSSRLHQDIREDAQGIIKTAQAIDKDFTLIGDNIRELFPKDRSSGTDSDCDHSSEEWKKWKKLHDDYKKLFLDSQMTANQLKNSIKSLTEDIIPYLEDPKNLLDEKKSQIRSYMEGLKRGQKDGADIETRFRQLQDEIVYFRWELYGALQNRRKYPIWLHSESSETIENLQEEIRQVGLRIEKMSHFFTRCWDVVNSTFNSSTSKFPDKLTKISGSAMMAAAHISSIPALHGLIALSALVPMVSIPLLVILVSILSEELVQSVRVNSAKIDDQKKKLKELEGQLKKIQQDEKTKAKEKIKELTANFNNIQDRLLGVRSVWRHLMDQTQSILSHLEMMENRNTTSYLFDCNFERLKTMWNIVFDALDGYTLILLQSHNT